MGQKPSEGRGCAHRSLGKGFSIQVASAKERTGPYGQQPSPTFDSDLMELQASAAAQKSTCPLSGHLPPPGCSFRPHFVFVFALTDKACRAGPLLWEAQSDFRATQSSEPVPLSPPRP